MCAEISIILPFFQAKETLDDAVQSVVSQDFQSWELILINDGSFDGSEIIAKKWCELDSRITLVNQSNQGRSIARNKGIEKTKTEWICFLDSDDVMPFDALSNLKKGIKNSDVVVAAYKKEKGVKEDSFLHHYSGKELVRLMVDPFCEENVDLIKPPDSVCLDSVWAKLYRRNVIIDNNVRFAPDVKFGEDFLFNCFVYAGSRQVQVSNEVVYVYNEQTEGTMRQFTIGDVSALDDSISVAMRVFDQLISQDLITQHNAEYYVGRIVYSAFGRASLYGLNKKKIFCGFETIIERPGIDRALKEYGKRDNKGFLYIKIVSYLLRHKQFGAASWIRSFSARARTLV